MSSLDDIPSLDDPVVWKESGQDLLRRGQFEEAIQCFTKAIELDPDYINAWNLLGYTYLKLGRIEDANKCEIIRKEIKLKQPQNQNIPDKPEKDNVVPAEIIRPIPPPTPEQVRAVEVPDEQYIGSVIHRNLNRNYLGSFQNIVGGGGVGYGLVLTDRRLIGMNLPRDFIKDASAGLAGGLGAGLLLAPFVGPAGMIWAQGAVRAKRAQKLSEQPDFIPVIEKWKDFEVPLRDIREIETKKPSWFCGYVKIKSGSSQLYLTIDELKIFDDVLSLFEVGNLNRLVR